MAGNFPRHFNSAQMANRRIASRKRPTLKDQNQQDDEEVEEDHTIPLFAKTPESIDNAAKAVFTSSGGTGIFCGPGLFGGGIYASSSFDFTATLPNAGPALSFPPAKWGNPNARSMSDWEGDEERDHDIRRKQPSQPVLNMTSTLNDSLSTAFQPVTQSTLNQGLNHLAEEASPLPTPQPPVNPFQSSAHPTIIQASNPIVEEAAPQHSTFQMVPMSTLTDASSLPTTQPSSSLSELAPQPTMDQASEPTVEEAQMIPMSTLTEASSLPTTQPSLNLSEPAPQPTMDQAPDPIVEEAAPQNSPFHNIMMLTSMEASPLPTPQPPINPFQPSPQPPIIQASNPIVEEAAPQNSPFHIITMSTSMEASPLPTPQPPINPFQPSPRPPIIQASNPIVEEAAPQNSPFHIITMSTSMEASPLPTPQPPINPFQPSPQPTIVQASNPIVEEAAPQHSPFQMVPTFSGQPRSKFALPQLPALPFGFFRSPSAEVPKSGIISMHEVLSDLDCLTIGPPKWGSEDIELPDAFDEELPTESWSNNNEMEVESVVENDDPDEVLTDAPEIPLPSTFSLPASVSSNIFGQPQLPTRSEPSHLFFDAAKEFKENTPPTPNFFGNPQAAQTIEGNVALASNILTFPEQANNIKPSSSFTFGSPTPPSNTSANPLTNLNPHAVKEFKENTPPTSNFFGNPQAAQTIEGNVALASNIFTFPEQANNIKPSSSFTFGSPTPPSNTSANPLTNLNQTAPQSVNRDGITNIFNSTGIDANAAIAVPSSPRPASASLKPFSTPHPDAESSSLSSSLTHGMTESASAPKQSDSILPAIGPNQSDAGRSGMSNLFPSMKPVDASSDTMTSNASRSGQSTTSSTFSKQQPSGAAAESISLVHGNASEKSASIEESSSVFVMGEVSDLELESSVPRDFNEEQRTQFFAGYRLRALQKGFKAAIAAADLSMNFTPALLSYKNQRERIEYALENQLKNLKRRRGEHVDDDVGGPAKRSKVSDISTQETLQSLASSAHNMISQAETNLSSAKSQSFKNGSTTPKVAPPAAGPSQPQTFTPVSPSLQSKRKAELHITKLNPDGESAEKQSQKIAKLQESSGALESPRSKRKAEVQITQLDPHGEHEAKRSQKIAKLDGKSGGSETSNIFKNILENPAQLPATTSPRKMFSLTKAADESDEPRFNAFATLAVPSSSIKSTTPISDPALFASTTMPAAQSNLSMSATSSTDAFSKFSSTPSASLNTNMFAKSASTTAAATSNPPEAQSGGASPTLFPQSTPSSRSLFGTKPSTAPTISSPLAKAPATVDDLTGTVPLTTTNSSFKPVFGNNLKSAPAVGVLKAPTFGAPVNFLAQFGKSAADTEKDAMEKAKMEDMDSDEDEEEWEANYKAKRQAERQELDEIAKKAKRFSVTPTTSATSSEKGSSPPPKSPPKSIFAQPAASGLASKSLLPPVNRSAASSPGLISSNGSSIFDSLSSAKPVTFADNIFGHLSDVDSGADSGKGNDADDDTDDSLSDENEDDDAEENVEPDETDDEKKDVTYDPTASVSAGPGTPSTPHTPVEETGIGIASAKKSFAFGSLSNSGASTPSLFDRINKDVKGNPIRQISTDDKENPNPGTSTPSLFDRITKDANGNPIRQMPTDDKEIPNPALTSIFTKNTSTSAPAVFNFSRSTETDATKAASDNTWKPDTPIKFGQSASTPIFNFGTGPSTPPAVNVQAPTPTKGSPFAGFGSTNPPPSTMPTLGSGGASLFTGLFGSTNTTQPTTSLFSNLGSAENKPSAVGFNFGGTSTTSSLFPSVAGSGVTSRATTPGVTTDGESANEGRDHEEIGIDEQINLGSSGAGEVDEEVMFEVRTKALRYELPTASGEGTAHEKAWIVKGLGNIRILKHKDTGLTRMLMRTDPSGTVVLNKRILPLTYQSSQKTIKITTSDDAGKGMESWVLQVKTPELAIELAAALEKNKSP